jgi:hypothetical protein
VWVVLLAGSLACVGHLPAVVSYGVAATSGLPNEEQGLATGLVTSAQQIGMTVGVPLLAAVAAAAEGARTGPAATLTGVRAGLLVDGVATVLVALAVGAALGASGRGKRRGSAVVAERQRAWRGSSTERYPTGE